jgi:hypothetical protein
VRDPTLTCLEMLHQHCVLVTKNRVAMLLKIFMVSISTTVHCAASMVVMHSVNNKIEMIMCADSNASKGLLKDGGLDWLRYQIVFVLS